MNLEITIESFSIKNINKLINKINRLIKSNFFFFKTINNCWSIKIISLPTKKTKHTLLKSPHVNKKAREQFEVRIHKRLILLSSKLLINKSSFLIVLYYLSKILKESPFKTLCKSKITISNL